jgi:hypothetical protein
VSHARLTGYVNLLCDIFCDPLEPHGARGDVCMGNLSTAGGNHLFGKP